LSIPSLGGGEINFASVGRDDPGALLA